MRSISMRTLLVTAWWLGANVSGAKPSWLAAKVKVGRVVVVAGTDILDYTVVATARIADVAHQLAGGLHMSSL